MGFETAGEHEEKPEADYIGFADNEPREQGGV